MTDTPTPTFQDTSFKTYAGQLVKDGTRANVPALPLESTMDKTAISNLTTINGLLPKCSDVLIFDTRVFKNPLDAVFRKMAMPFGAYVEMAQFSAGATNKKNNEDTCFPKGNVSMVTQYALHNYGYDIDISVGDFEINKGIMSEAQVQRYIAEKLRTPLKREALIRYRSMVQLISDTITGSRTLTSTDGNGNAVTYNPTSITGYAGKVISSGITLDNVARASLPAFASADDALTVAKQIKGVCRDIMIDANDYTGLQNDNFVMGRPNVIMEAKVLDAMDNVFAMNGNYKAFPTKTAREYFGEFCDLVEIDAFATLPDGNATYPNKSVSGTQGFRNLAVVCDKEMGHEFVTQETVEAFRCAKQRATGWNYQCESSITLYKGVPSCAVLCNLPSV